MFSLEKFLYPCMMKSMKRWMLFLMEDILYKKMSYQSSHRGMKELDSILGRFFDENYSNFSYNERMLYNNLLKEEYSNIYNWVMGLKKSESYEDLILKIRLFYKL